MNEWMNDTEFSFVHGFRFSIKVNIEILLDVKRHVHGWSVYKLGDQVRYLRFFEMLNIHLSFNLGFNKKRQKLGKSS